MIRFNCPNCHKKLKAPIEKAGVVGACTKCKFRFMIPAGNLLPPGIFLESTTKSFSHEKKEYSQAIKNEVNSQNFISDWGHISFIKQYWPYSLIVIAILFAVGWSCIIVNTTKKQNIKSKLDDSINETISKRPVKPSTETEQVSNSNKLQVPEVIKYRELTQSKKFGRVWRAIIIEKGVGKEELISLARHLHKGDPASSVRFFDDDTLFEQFRGWDENYPNPKFPSPEKWADEHYIALLNLIQDNKGRRWELWTMFSNPQLGETQNLAVIE